MKGKLLNITNCQVLLSLLISVCVQCQSHQLGVNVSHYERPFERILTRRKRFLVYRPMSNLLLTGSLVKPIVSPKPSGLNAIYEWDIYYPLPTTWHKPTKKPLVAVGRPPPIVFEHDHPEIIIDHPPTGHDFDAFAKDHPGEIFLPPGGFSSDVIGNINNAPSIAPKRRNWSPIITSNTWNKSNNFQTAFNPQPVTQNNPFQTNRRWQQPQTIVYPQQRFNGLNNFNTFNQRQLNGQTYSPMQQPNLFGARGRSLAFNEQANNTEHQQGEHDELRDIHHRDRRDLYSRLEGAFKGFGIPVKNGNNDDYSSAMQAKAGDCEVYGAKCPLSVLSFLLYSKN